MLNKSPVIYICNSLTVDYVWQQGTHLKMTKIVKCNHYALIGDKTSILDRLIIYSYAQTKYSRIYILSYQSLKQTLY